MTIRTMASRHSAFYSPFLCAIQWLRNEGHHVPYSVLGPGQSSHVLIGRGEIDIMQSAVSSNWKPREQGIEPLPVHFAQINRRDGFFIVAREPIADFHWTLLKGISLLADHGGQPLAMLKYAIQYNKTDWNKIKVIDAGTPQEMADSFAAGRGDYLHLQAPVVTGHIVASVGASMPPVAFSSLCCAREFQKTEAYRTFFDIYRRAKSWVQTAPPHEVASAVSSFFLAIPSDLLVSTIQRYQALGCWEGGIEIPRDLYEQALNVFESVGAIASRHPYEEVAA